MLWKIILSAVLLILSFPNFNVEFLAWFALVPLFFAIEGQRPSRAFLLSYICGIFFFFGTIWWLIHVTLPGMIAAVLYLALYFGLFGIFLAVTRQPSAVSLLAVAPAAWVALEWIRSIGMFGFGWVLLSHSQSNSLPMIQIADITGAYGVSFLIVMANTAVYLVIRDFRGKKRDFLLPVLIASFILFISLAYGQFRLKNIFTGERLKVSVVQGNIPQDEKWDTEFREAILSKYETLTREAANTKPDLIVWPEASVPGFLESERSLFERVKSLVIDINTPLLVGTVRESRGEKGTRYYNSAVLFAEDGRVIDVYDKIHLVPFGEYIPFKKAFSFVEKFAAIPIGDCSSGSEYKVFRFFIERSLDEKEFKWRMVKKAAFSTLICFEDIFPEISRRFVKNGADFLVNITNDGWYKISSAPYQHVQNSVFRAVENRTSVVRAANTGISCFIDQKGKVLSFVEKEGKSIAVDGFRTDEIVLARNATFYNRYGDLFAYLCILSLALAYPYIRRKTRKRPVAAIFTR